MREVFIMMLLPLVYSEMFRKCFSFGGLRDGRAGCTIKSTTFVETVAFMWLGALSGDR